MTIKKLFSLFLFISVLFAVSGQISLTQDDFFSAGDRVPFIKYSPEDTDTIYFHELYSENPIFDHLNWSNQDLDSIVFYNPSVVDANNQFTEANCTYITEEGYFMHLLITEDYVKQIGVQVNIFGVENLDLNFEDEIILYEFPINFNSEFSSSSSANQTEHISEYEEIVSEIADYETIVALFDSVKFEFSIAYNFDFDESGSMSFIGPYNLNGNYDYLREKSHTSIGFDILLRNIFTGTYTSIGSIPGVPLPPGVELPIITNSYSYNYWTQAHKYPLAEVRTNETYEQVFSVNQRYYSYSYANELSSNKVNVYPNPASSFVIFDFESPLSREVVIYDNSGKISDRFVTQTDSYKFCSENLSKGVYFYQIFDNSNNIYGSGKFLIIK